jgi:hypothetical protein
LLVFVPSTPDTRHSCVTEQRDSER